MSQIIQSKKARKKGNKQSPSFSAAQLGEIHRLIYRDMSKKADTHVYRQLWGPTSYNSALTGADSNTLLYSISQGSENHDRDGESILLKSINLKGCISLIGGVLAQSCVATILVLNCKTSLLVNGANLPWTSLLDSTTNGTYVAWTGLSSDRFLEINNQDFELLARRDIPLDVIFSTTATQAYVSEYNNVSKDFEINLDYGAGRKVNYEEGTNLPSNFNPFFAITCSDNFASAGVYASTVSAVVVSKVKFQDM